jgi:choline dehydrogenase-like flavoprotein
MRRSPCRLVADTLYDFVVVGGGAAGSAIAAKLANENMKTLVVERGADATKAPAWHTEMPAAGFAHRAHGRYVKAVTTSERQGNYLRGAKAVAASSSDADAAADAAAAAAPRATMDVMVPNVLGGASVVLGGKSWVRGHADDWPDFPLDFEADVLPMFKKIEAQGGLASLHAHRGQEGLMTMSRATFFNRLHKPILELLVQKGHMGLVSDFNTAEGFGRVGLGRTETMVDSYNGRAYGPVPTYLKRSLTLKRPLTVLADAEAVGLTFDADGKVAESLAVMSGKGEMQSIRAKHFVMAAGALGTPRVLLSPYAKASGGVGASAASLADVGKNLWAVPSVTLAYPTAEPHSLAGLANPLVRLMAYVDWRFRERGWGTSAFDDLALFLATPLGAADCGSAKAAYPDVRVNVEPFILNDDHSVSETHGFQFKIQLIRPASRGQVFADGGADPQVFGADADCAAMQTAVGVIKAIMAEHGGPLTRKAPPLREVVAVDGPVGGTCRMGNPGDAGVAVDAKTMRLVGTDNVSVVDGSVVPRGVVADSVPLVLALVERAADILVPKAPSIY